MLKSSKRTKSAYCDRKSRETNRESRLTHVRSSSEATREQVSPRQPQPQSTLLKARTGIRHGDNRFLGELLESYWHDLRTLADLQLDRKLRGRFGPSDIVQETMLHAYRDFHQFQGVCEREFYGWLKSIFANTLARTVEAHVTTKKRDVRRELPISRNHARDYREPHVHLVAKGRTPSETAQVRERATILNELVNRLTDAQREVLTLRNGNGLKFSEVASVSGRSVAATKMLWVRSLRQLRKLYEHRDEG